jgi:hypothetical protein
MTRKTYVYRNGELVEKYPQMEHSDAPMVMPDIQPYQSMIDGSMITSRSKHREHLRDNNCIEIGNETLETKLAPVKDNRREVLQAQLANMTHSQANKLLDKMRDEIRFTNRPYRG